VRFIAGFRRHANRGMPRGRACASAGLALLAAIGMHATAIAAADAPVELWRMDCGTFVTKRLTNSC